MIGIENEKPVARLEKVWIGTMENAWFGDDQIVVNLSGLSTQPLMVRPYI